MAASDERSKGAKSVGSLDFDPVSLAMRQLALDKARTKRFPELLVRKVERMSASPLAFLRGAAPLFYEGLAARPQLAEGPAAEGWIVGDMHLENFGAYRTDSPDGPASGKKHHRAVVFGLNDFDDALVGPWRLDVLRLTTSLLLGGRELGASGVVALSLVDRLIDAWAKGAFDGAQPGEEPPPVKALVEQVRSRSKTALLDQRTQILKGGSRRFVRGARYADLPKAIVDEVPKALEKYVASLPEEQRPHKASLEPVDCALRIAGTGSLGGLRVAVLVRGKGLPDGAWVFDLKEQGDPSAAPLVAPPSMDPAERVATAYKKCAERP
ncbi:MAG TPA: DUF2252 family protein, partial [Labilithrix sp.]